MTMLRPRVLLLSFMLLMLLCSLIGIVKSSREPPPDVMPEPVMPEYNLSRVPLYYTRPPTQHTKDIFELRNRDAIRYMTNSCLTHAENPHNIKNHLFPVLDGVTGLSDTPTNGYLSGVTYWINDFLHVGHVHYDIAIVEALSAMRVDRIIMQRAVCNGMLCSGLGSMDSFYKGYFAAVLATAGQPKVPVYLRWQWKTSHVAPFYFSVDTDDYYYDGEFGPPNKRPSIQLKRIMCFEHILTRSDLKLGATAAVSADTVQRFKSVAYKMVRANPPLSTKFARGPPYRILVSYRGPSTSRHISNLDVFVGYLQKSFPPSEGYIIRLLNNSDPFMDLKTQLTAVAESHVVITNHGAFEGNMIYMKNSSLLLEIYGNYFTAEVHTFHRLAMMYGLYYARVHPANMTAHQQSSFELSDLEIKNYTSIVQNFFHRKAYLLNAD